jgi:hypothetical protein
MATPTGWPTDQVEPLTPPAGAPTGPAPSNRRRSWLIAGALVLCLAVGIGGFFALRNFVGWFGGAVGPTLTQEQFLVLAHETLPTTAQIRPLDVHPNNGLVDGILAQFCPNNMVSTEDLELGASGSVELKLFTANRHADNYLDGLVSCLSHASENYVVVSETTTDDVHMVSIETLGVTVEQLAGYGNVVVAQTFGDDSWEHFAVDQFKPAVIEAAQS